MPGISRDVIDHVRDANDIVEVIGAHLALKKAGSSFKTLCPFHKEKTPSFNVTPHKQIFHCFGCGAGGDVFKFVQQYEGVDFVTAVRILAKRAGIDIQYDEEAGTDRQSKDKLYKLHEDIAAWFHSQLNSTAAEEARAYLAQREFGEDIIRAFQFGYAPAAGQAVLRWGRQHGYTPEMLKEAGIVNQSDNPNDRSPWYCRFRHRLMIPIRDTIGRTIAFTGRVLSKNQTGGKYVNSPETILFKKNRVLFALDLARPAMAAEQRVIVCEGQLDAIRCHAAGVTHVVATQGTAFTENHARILARSTPEVILVLDPDTAGRKAAITAARTLLELDLHVRIATLPEGEDPDSLITSQGVDAFRDCIRKACSIMTFQSAVLRRLEDPSTPTGVRRIEESVFETLSHIHSAAVRDQFIREAAEQLNLREESLRQDFRRRAQRRRPRSAARDEYAPVQQPKHPEEERALAELVLEYESVADLIRRYLPRELITSPACRAIIETALRHTAPDGWNPIHDLSAAADEEAHRLAAELTAEARPIRGEEVSPEQAAHELILVIHRKKLERDRNALRHDAPGEEQLRQRAQLTHDINSLRQGWDQALPVLELILHQ